MQRFRHPQQIRLQQQQQQQQHHLLRLLLRPLLPNPPLPPIHPTITWSFLPRVRHNKTGNRLSFFIMPTKSNNRDLWYVKRRVDAAAGSVCLAIVSWAA